jgi:uncharacterized RDD family membrane protein YckC
MRFDEIELEAVALGIESESEAAVAEEDRARWHKRLLALLTDLSLFVALTLALSPLLPPAASWLAAASLAGFVVVISFYYFVGSWMLWGKTIGGAIFDVKLVADEGALSVPVASLRWIVFVGSLLVAGLPLLFRVPDRVAGTRTINA